MYYLRSVDTQDLNRPILVPLQTGPTYPPPSLGDHLRDGRTQERERRLKDGFWHVRTIVGFDLEDEDGLRIILEAWR